MGKHGDDYARVERDDYPTPAWVIGALAEHFRLRGRITWEMACGKEGRMSEALKAAGCARVYSTDIIITTSARMSSSTSSQGSFLICRIAMQW